MLNYFLVLEWEACSKHSCTPPPSLLHYTKRGYLINRRGRKVFKYVVSEIKAASFIRLLLISRTLKDTSPRRILHCQSFIDPSYSLATLFRSGSYQTWSRFTQSVWSNSRSHFVRGYVSLMLSAMQPILSPLTKASRASKRCNP